MLLESLNQIDTQIFLFFNGAHSPFFDVFMKLFTGKWIWVPMYAAILLMVWRATRSPRFIFYLLGAVLTICITDQVCATCIRPLVERLRPSNLQNELSQLAYIVGDYRGGRYGFPSCHAANSFGLAVFMSLLVRKRSFVIFILGWALLNSYSRLYLGVHYPGDLFAGAVIGSLSALLCFNIVRRFADRNATATELTERADQPLFTLHVPSMQDLQLVLVRIASVSAQGLVKWVCFATILYIIVRAI